MKHPHLLLPTLLALGACTVSEPNGAPSIVTAVIVDSISTDTMPLADYRMFAYEAGWYVFLDPTSTRVTEFNPSTGAVFSLEAPGRGPGELAQPKDLARRNGSTYVFDHQPAALHRFGPGLVFENREPFPEGAFSVKPLGDSAWLLHEFDPSMVVLGKIDGTTPVFEHQVPVSHMSQSGVVLGSDPGSTRAVAAALFSGAFWLRDPDGTWTNHVNPEVPAENPMVSVGPVSMPTYKMQHAAFFIHGSPCLVYGSTRLDLSEPGETKRILCFRMDGTPLARIELPRIDGPVLTTGDTLHLYQLTTRYVHRYIIPRFDAP